MISASRQFRVSSGSFLTSFPSSVEIPSDHDLMRAVRDGDIPRLGELFERHHRPLFGFFLHLTRQPALSEDLVQTVFHRILKYRHTYRDEGKFSAWIYHLARMAAADQFRKHAHTPASFDPADLPDHPDTRPTPDDQAATSEDVALLRQALTRLPLAHREVLVLTRLQQLEHQVVARLLGCSTGALKVRVHRALKELRQVYHKLQRTSRQAL